MPLSGLSIRPARAEDLPALVALLSADALGGHGDTSMLIKYGPISDVKLGRKEVSAAFEIKIDFGEVAFENIDAARTVFGADKFQLYRTHWAVS